MMGTLDGISILDDPMHIKSLSLALLQAFAEPLVVKDGKIISGVFWLECTSNFPQKKRSLPGRKPLSGYGKGFHAR